jgi:hypothetical protein
VLKINISLLTYSFFNFSFSFLCSISWFSAIIIIVIIVIIIIIIIISSSSSSSSSSISIIITVLSGIKRLRPSKYFALDGISSFAIKGCYKIFVPVLKFIFKFSFSQQTFPALCKQAAIVPVLKKRNCASVTYYRPTSIINNFSKIF